MDDTQYFYTDKGKDIFSLTKWCNEYRREYSKLYYKIRIKEQYSDKELEIFNKMCKKYKKRESYTKKEGLSVIKKSVSITFD